MSTSPVAISNKSVKIGDQIGAGTYGTVHRGRWKHQDVAVKILNIS